MNNKSQQLLQKLSKLAKQYNQKPTHHYNDTPKKRINKLHSKRSRFRSINYEKHLKALRNQNIQR